MKRVKTGVPGLDELIEGGFPEGSSILVSGGPGTGKSIFCMEYLYNGAKDYGDAGLYATLEEGPHNLWWNMQRFNWDLLSLEKENKLKIIKFDPDLSNRENLEEQVLQIVDKAKEMGARRLVIDSITAFSFWVKDVSTVRFAMYSLIERRKARAFPIRRRRVPGGRGHPDVLQRAQPLAVRPENARNQQLKIPSPGGNKRPWPRRQVQGRASLGVAQGVI